MATAPDPNHSYDHDDEDYLCPICCEILQEPYLTECCGQHFCADCIAKAKRKVDRCPYCQKEPLTGITDKYLNRRLREMYGDVVNHQEESNGQQTSNPPSQQQDVPNCPENARQESSGEQTQQSTCNVLQRLDPSEELTRDIIATHERDARERRVDNVVQMTTTVSGTGLGGVGATLGGVAVGAAIGSVVPAVGTLIGGTIGGIAGGVTGVAGGSFIGFGVGRLTNRFRRTPLVQNAIKRIPFPSRIRN